MLNIGSSVKEDYLLYTVVAKVLSYSHEMKKKEIKLIGWSERQIDKETLFF